LLQEPNGHIDWIDVSELMLEQAKRYLRETNLEERNKVISFIEMEILDYLSTLGDNSLDLVIMKYTFEHIENIDQLFSLLSHKLKKNGRFVATLSSLSPQLKSSSTNARFLYNGQEFPLDETREMTDGDTFTIRFYKQSGNPSAGHLEGAETTKYYHSENKMKDLSRKYNLDIQVGDWKEIEGVSQGNLEQLSLGVLVLRKR